MASEGPAVFFRTAVLASNFVLVLSWQPSHSLPRQGEQWSTVSVRTLPKKLWSTSPDGPQFLVEHCAIQNCGPLPKKQSLEYLQGRMSFKRRMNWVAHETKIMCSGNFRGGPQGHNSLHDCTGRGHIGWKRGEVVSGTNRACRVRVPTRRPRRIMGLSGIVLHILMEGSRLLNAADARCGAPA